MDWWCELYDAPSDCYRGWALIVGFYPSLDKESALYFGASVPLGDSYDLNINYYLDDNPDLLNSIMFSKI